MPHRPYEHPLVSFSRKVAPSGFVLYASPRGCLVDGEAARGPAPDRFGDDEEGAPEGLGERQGARLRRQDLVALDDLLRRQDGGVEHLVRDDRVEGAVGGLRVPGPAAHSFEVVGQLPLVGAAPGQLP